jgi:hypothetical protein
MAAVLACGEGAVLSHMSAAELWGIRRHPRRSSGGRGAGTIHVTVPGTAGRRKRNGVILHRSSTLTVSDCTRRDGIPVTRPTRTLSDLRLLLSPGQFNAAVREAEFRGLQIGDFSVTARTASRSTRIAHAPSSSSGCSPSAAATAFPGPR